MISGIQRLRTCPATVKPVTAQTGDSSDDNLDFFDLIYIIKTTFFQVAEGRTCSKTKKSTFKSYIKKLTSMVKALITQDNDDFSDYATSNAATNTSLVVPDEDGDSSTKEVGFQHAFMLLEARIASFETAVDKLALVNGQFSAEEFSA